MDKLKLKYFIDIGLIIAFLVSFITGIIKFPAFSKCFSPVYTLIPYYYLSKIHDWSGLVLSLLVFAHLILNWKWIVATTKIFFKRGK